MKSSDLHSDPLYIKVYSLLKEWILDGELASGERIGETAMAEKLRVSRTPVRDALRRLEQDRLIVPVSGQAYEVYRPTAQDLEDLYTARVLLECGAARLAAERHSVEIFERMAAILAQMPAAYHEGSRSVLVELDQQFHELMVAASGNPVLVELHSHLATRLRHVRSMSGDVSLRQQQVHEQHAAIIDALLSGSADAAEQAVRTHIMAISGLISSRRPSQRERSGFRA